MIPLFILLCLLKSSRPYIKKVITTDITNEEFMNAFLEILLKIIFKTNILPKGDMKNGNNCYICYCTLKNNLF